MPNSVPAFRSRRLAAGSRRSPALAPREKCALSNPCASASFAEGARPCTNSILGADSLLNHVHELFA